jgi:hypothetical protein
LAGGIRSSTRHVGERAVGLGLCPVVEVVPDQRAVMIRIVTRAGRGSALRHWMVHRRQRTIRVGGAAMQDGLARIRKYWLPVGLAIVLALMWLVPVFGNLGDGNIAILALSIPGGLLAALVGPRHPLRNGMVGGGALLALAWATRAVYQAASGMVNVGEYGSWEMYWLTSLIALVAFAVEGAVLGYVGGYVVRYATQRRPRTDGGPDRLS